MTVAVIAFTRRGAALGKTLAAALGGTLAGRFPLWTPGRRHSGGRPRD